MYNCVETRKNEFIATMGIFAGQEKRKNSVLFFQPLYRPDLPPRSHSRKVKYKNENKKNLNPEDVDEKQRRSKLARPDKI